MLLHATFVLLQYKPTGPGGVRGRVRLSSQATGLTGAHGTSLTTFRRAANHCSTLTIVAGPRYPTALLQRPTIVSNCYNNTRSYSSMCAAMLSCSSTVRIGKKRLLYITVQQARARIYLSVLSSFRGQYLPATCRACE